MIFLLLQKKRSSFIISKYESSHQSNRLDKSSSETNIDVRAFHAADENRGHWFRWAGRQNTNDKCQGLPWRLRKFSGKLAAESAQLRKTIRRCPVSCRARTGLCVISMITTKQKPIPIDSSE